VKISDCPSRLRSGGSYDEALVPSFACHGAILILALLLLFGSAGALADHNPVPAAPATAHAAASAPERHPEIREAIESLRHARAHIEHAAHDSVAIAKRRCEPPTRPFVNSKFACDSTETRGGGGFLQFVRMEALVRSCRTLPSLLVGRCPLSNCGWLAFHSPGGGLIR
jgi:hypothetical protein